MKLVWPQKRSMLALSGVLLSATLIASACSSDNNAESSGTLPDLMTDTETIVLNASLDTIDSCDNLLDRIKRDAMDRVGPYGFGPGNISDHLDDMVENEGATTELGAPDSAKAGANSGSKETSGTNNQESGVDEADFVKSDGSTLAVINQTTLRIVDVTGETPEQTRSISIASLGNPTGMFLNGDQLVLLSQEYSRDGATTLITNIDTVSGTVGSSAEFDGKYVSSRTTDGTLRLVMSSTPQRIDFVYPDGRTNEDQATEENRALIEKSELDDWIPQYRITGDTRRQATEALVDCDQLYVPKGFSGPGQVSIVTVELNKPLDVVDALSIYTDAETVYASTDRLVVAATQWPEMSEDGGMFSSPPETVLHSFDTAPNKKTDYLASGLVRGTLLNQFSISEHEGNLRVATTDDVQTERWGLRISDDIDPRGSSESFITILSEEGGALVPQGQVGQIGRGEDIYAVRFIGDVGYVVTFRQIDPLYTIDLSNPSNPQILGELKIPGFSNYLHAVDDRTLLGVGSDGTDDGQVLGAAVSLFDIEDLSDPTRLDKYAFDENSYSPVASDAKAFTYWADTSTVIVPIESRSNNNGRESSADVLNLDLETGRIKHQGSINHAELCQNQSVQNTGHRTPLIPTDVDDQGAASDPAVGQPIAETQPAPQPTPGEDFAPRCDDYGTTINRTMVIGDDLYVFSEAGISVHTLDELREKAWVSFT